MWVSTKTSTVLAGIVAALAAGTLIVAGAAAAPTAVSKAKRATLIGTSDWGSTFTNETYAIEGSFDGTFGKGTYAGTLTPGAWYWDFPECGPSCALVTGTINFSTKHGTLTAALQPGSIVIASDIASHSWRTFTSSATGAGTPLNLEIVSGTRSYAHANGLLMLSYVSTWSHYYDSDKGVLVNEIVDTGTLTDIRDARSAASTDKQVLRASFDVTPA